MKSLFLVCFLMTSVLFANVELQSVTHRSFVSRALESGPFDPSTWMMGAKLDYKVYAGTNEIGTFHKEVVGITADYVWVRSEIKSTIENSRMLAKIDKATGSIERVITDGHDKGSQSWVYELINDLSEDVVVPAGSFSCKHYVLTNEETTETTDIWMGDTDLALDNTVKAEYFLNGTMIRYELISYQK